MNDRSDGFAAPTGHLDRVHDEFRAQVIGDRQADATAREHINDGGAVDPSFERSVLRDIFDPKLVGCVSGKYPLDVILEYRRKPARAAPTPFAVVNALQPCDAHQSLDPAAPYPQTQPEDEFGVNTTDP